MSPDRRRPSNTLPPRLRSARTNGKKLFVGGDGNSAWSRRWKDLRALYVCDLGGQLNAFQQGLIESAATLRCEIEKMESELSRGGEVDIDLLSRTAGHFRRICQT